VVFPPLENQRASKIIPLLLVNSQRKGPHMGSSTKTWPTRVWGSVTFVRSLRRPTITYSWNVNLQNKSGKKWRTIWGPYPSGPKIIY
jgi:hypothetical protein